MASGTVRLNLYPEDPRLRLKKQVLTPLDRTRLEIQSEKELHILNTVRTCRIGNINPDVAKNIRYKWDSKGVSDLLKNHFYQEDVLQTLLCTIEDLTPSTSRQISKRNSK
jgi:hypothetical protein